jgi:hypothetical protein
VMEGALASRECRVTQCEIRQLDCHRSFAPQSPARGRLRRKFTRLIDCYITFSR